MPNPNPTRFPNPGRLGLALLEHFVEPIIGKDARDILKTPVVEKELTTVLAQTLATTEDRFQSTFQDTTIADALVNLPLASLPSLKQAVRSFYNQPTDHTLRQVLSDKMKESFPSLDKGRVESAVDSYLAILKEELVVAAPTPEFREKINVLVLQSMQADTSRMQQILSEILLILKSWGHADTGTQLVQQPIHEMDPSQTQQLLFEIRHVIDAWRAPAFGQPGTSFVQQHQFGSMGSRCMPFVSQYERLRSWLDNLVEQEFRDLIRTVLPTARERNSMRTPPDVCTRSDFLGYIQDRDRLDDLQVYLQQRYSDRSPE